MLCCGILLRPAVAAALPVTAAAAPSDAGWTWIWAHDDAKTPDTVFFRQKFALPEKPLAAKLTICADDQFKAYFNAHTRPDATGTDWTTTQIFDVTGLLKAGDNLLAIEATNLSGPGGLLYKLTVTLPRKKTLTFFSDARVRCNRRPPPGWNNPALDDRQWNAARELAPAGSGTWGTLHTAPQPDYGWLVPQWNIRAAERPEVNPYAQTRHVGDRMLLATNVASASAMQTLAGAGFTLFQTDSDHLSTEEIAPNRWDFQAADAQRRAVQNLGLDWCYFPHYAFPPAWFRTSPGFTRLECLEHHQPVQAFSLWDTTWPAFIERGYNALSQQFGTAGRPSNNAKQEKQELNAIVVGIHGDYGEAGLLSGARLAVPKGRTDWQKRFGDQHDHLGFWCNDPLARADFRNAMLKKYGTLEALNAAWQRDFKKPEDITYPATPRNEARAEWLDFINWYQQSVGNAVESNLTAARKISPTHCSCSPPGSVMRTCAAARTTA